MGKAVLKDWVIGLDWKSQTGLISIVRGIDNLNDKDTEVVKVLTKSLRGLILNNADSNTSFMTDGPTNMSDVAKLITTLKDIKNSDDGECVVGNDHWVDHFKLAITIIANKHPNAYVRVYYNQVKSLMFN